MILKCIGGERDGAHINVPDEYPVGHYFKVPSKYPAILDIGQPGASPLSNTVSVTYYEYEIDIIHFSKNDTYKFLRPVNWTNKKAIMHQFNK